MAQFGFGSNLTLPFLGLGSGSNNGGNNNNNVTVITYLTNFSGTVINSPVTINNIMNVQVIEGGLTLTIIEDFTFNNNTINLITEVHNQNITVINHNVNQEIIQNEIKGGFANTEQAKAGGVKVGEMYYLIQENDPAMYSGVVVYIAQ